MAPVVVVVVTVVAVVTVVVVVERERAKSSLAKGDCALHPCRRAVLQRRGTLRHAYMGCVGPFRGAREKGIAAAAHCGRLRVAADRNHAKSPTSYPFRSSSKQTSDAAGLGGIKRPRRARCVADRQRYRLLAAGLRGCGAAGWLQWFLVAVQAAGNLAVATRGCDCFQN